MKSRQYARWACLILMSASLTSCNGRPRSGSGEGDPGLSGRGHISIVDLSQGAAENPLSGGLFPAPPGQTFYGLIESLDAIEKDKQSQAVFIQLRGQSIGFSRSKEVGERLARLKEKKPVYCHTHEIDNPTLWLLSRGCSKIWVSSAGSVPTVGIGAELSYLKGAFDKAGVVADMMAMGKYKSGGEALTREGPSETSLQNLRDTLGDLRSQWLAGISKGEADPGRFEKNAEDGPWSPAKAKDLGLIDEVGFEDAALKALAESVHTDEKEIAYGPGKLDAAESPAAGILRLLLGGSERARGSDRVAIVPAVGSITMSAGGPFGGGDGITAAAMTRTLARLREDDSVRAIVMRMDSPGGSPLASDLIWREMMLTREVKPVIVSISGMSASGGYYIASGATKIVSSPTAIVGSIGVFGGKIVLSGAFEKVGVNHVAIAASEAEGASARANHMSAMTPWDEPTRERVRATMRRIYDLFVERVAEGRDMPKDKVYATAEGEIFLATVGKERGLVDELGGLADAIRIAKKEAGLPNEAPVVLEGAAESILEALLLGPEPAASEIEAALKRYEQRRLESIAELALSDGGLNALRPFAASVSPLLTGETTVAALPFLVEIH